MCLFSNLMDQSKLMFDHILDLNNSSHGLEFYFRKVIFIVISNEKCNTLVCKKRNQLKKMLPSIKKFSVILFE